MPSFIPWLINPTPPILNTQMVPISPRSTMVSGVFITNSVNLLWMVAKSIEILRHLKWMVETLKACKSWDVYNVSHLSTGNHRFSHEIWGFPAPTPHVLPGQPAHFAKILLHHLSPAWRESIRRNASAIIMASALQGLIVGWWRNLW